MYGAWLKEASPMAIGQQIEAGSDWRKYFTAILRRPDMSIFVAEVGGRAEGFVVGRIGNTGQADLIHRIGKVVRTVLQRRATRIARPRTVGIVDHLFMSPSSRNPYMAYDMMNAQFDWFREQGVTAVEGVIWSMNDTTLKMSKYLGFKPVRVMVRKELAEAAAPPQPGQ